MIRRHDFRCPEHGVFEHCESLDAPVSRSRPCPTCRRASPMVWIKAPTIGKINKGVFVVDFPAGKPGSGEKVTLTRDECERRLAIEPGVPSFDRDKIAERVDRLMQMQDSGTLPPPKPISEADAKRVTDALAKTGTSET